MGAKPPILVKSRRPTCKCDVCGRGFLSVQALRSHQTVTHPKSRQRVAYKPNTEVLTERSLMTAKKGNSMPAKKKAEKTNVENDAQELTKVEFKCPKCSELFSKCFYAVKHIQKKHCVNSEGEPVAPNSPDLIEPIRTEVCLSCHQCVDNAKHVCSAKDEYLKHMKYGLKCLACKKEFWKMTLYDLHISGIHSSDGETLFFPTLSEFTAWKRHMESQMQSSYIVISDSLITDKSVPKSIYRCPYFLQNCKGDMAGFCPSSIVVQEFPKGYQVHFYKEHYVHVTKPYKLEDAYKKYSIDLMMKNKNVIAVKPNSIEDNTDKYADFKKLMENIILDAEEADVECLKQLLEKALEMSALLNTGDDKATIADNKSITDDEISQVLNDTQVRSKRKVKSPVIDNSAKKVKKEAAEVNNTMRSPVNFNDTFKDFVGNIVKSPALKNDKKKVVKTKMGQFKPSPTKPKKKDESVIDKVEQLNDKSDLVPNVCELRLDLSKVKTEIEYEVREQENDCNILILKI